LRLPTSKVTGETQTEVTTFARRAKTRPPRTCLSILRWVQRYVPEFEQRWARYARRVHSSWRMDETAVSVRGGAHYLYRAVDKHGKTVDSLLCTDRSESAAMTFNTGNHTSAILVGLGLGKVVQLDAGYTLNAYAEVQPSLYRSGVGAPNYQVFTGISLQLPSHFTSGWQLF